ncbi:MAG TPA: serine/threonine-protein kinase [Planctomycetota bacterium]|nr:serine/threonine-protein kinase [Planctomycetota bacterium]
MSEQEAELAPVDPVEELLAACLDANDPAAAVERAAEAEPDLAPELRRRFDFLRRSGAVGARDAGEPRRRLGNFELGERLGGGGMGIVYRATELSIGRDVALKLIRPEHLWFDGARKRFLREIEAVAALDHPGIVPIYTAGEHDGVPFCAMELVRGSSLALVLATLGARDSSPDPAVLRQAGATNWTDACFALVRQVADALAHGHARGIVHRDVKPSNIMLGDDGRARLIDFGLARVASAATMTKSGVQPGSPAYMSPEQVRGEEVDARTDVWSLGVTLCELLTLRQPFAAGTEAATRQRILASATPLPSSRHSRVPWDAATVVATAMAPERERRYLSMAAFRDDLQRCLERRPIAARRAGPWLRTRRWLQRHPARAAAWLLAAFVFGVLPTTLLLQEEAARGRIEQEAERAVQAERAAMRKAQTSQRVVRFLQELFNEVDPDQARGNTVTARTILDRGLQRLRSELADEPEVRAELLDTLGQVYVSLGLIEPARELVAESLQLREQVLHQDGDALRSTLVLQAVIANLQGREAEAEAITRRVDGFAGTDARQHALGQIRLAYCAWRLGRTDEADRHYKQGLAALRQLLPPADAELIGAERSYAGFLRARVDPAAALALLTEVAARAAALPADHTTRLNLELDLAAAEIENEKLAAAEQRLRAAIALAERVFDANHPTLALLREELASALLQLDRYAEALQQYELVAPALEATYRAPHMQLARAASLESSLSIEVGDLPRAEAAATRAVAMFEQLYPEGHLDFAGVLTNLARIESQLGNLDRAEQLARRSLAMKRQLGERRVAAVVLPMCYLASAQAQRNELADAERNAREAVALATGAQALSGSRTLAIAETTLGEVLMYAGKHAEGEQAARRAIATWQAFGGAGDCRARFVLGWALDALGRFDEAERELRDVLASLARYYPPGHMFFGEVTGELGVVLARRGELPAAAGQLQRAVDIRRAAGGADNPLLGLPLLNLGTILQLQHREAEAVPIGFECLELVRRHGGAKNRLTPSVLLLLARTVTHLPAPSRQAQIERVRAAIDELLPAAFARRDEIVRELDATK